MIPFTTLEWHLWYVVPLAFIAGYALLHSHADDPEEFRTIFVLWALPAILAGVLAQNFK